MSFGTTVMQILSLFLIMIVGYVLRKRNVFDEASNVRFTRLIIYVKIKLFTAIYSNKNKITQKLFFVCLS